MKKHIREVFLELLKTNSIESMTMKQIAEAAEINRSTLYNYYGSLYSILGDCIYRIAGMADKHIPAGDNIAFMRGLWENNARAYRDVRDHVDLYGFIKKHPSRLLYDEDHVVILREHSKVYYQSVVDELFRRHDNPKVSKLYLGEALETLSGSVLSAWMKGGFKETPEEAADITQLFIEAVLDKSFE